MVSIIASEKGQGKTKALIKMANETAKSSDGHVVFIDDDPRHMYDLDREIRFVVTNEFPLSNYRELIGFIYGILSQNSDIKEIFIDGLGNVIKTFDGEALVKIVTKFKKMSDEKKLDIIFTINLVPEEVPEEVKDLLIQI